MSAIFFILSAIFIVLGFFGLFNPDKALKKIVKEPSKRTRGKVFGYYSTFAFSCLFVSVLFVPKKGVSKQAPAEQTVAKAVPEQTVVAKAVIREMGLDVTQTVKKQPVKKKIPGVWIFKQLKEGYTSGKCMHRPGENDAGKYAKSLKSVSMRIAKMVKKKNRCSVSEFSGAYVLNCMSMDHHLHAFNSEQVCITNQKRMLARQAKAKRLAH